MQFMQNGAMIKKVGKLTKLASPTRITPIV
jgi:hypothetical protein